MSKEANQRRDRTLLRLLKTKPQPRTSAADKKVKEDGEHLLAELKRLQDDPDRSLDRIADLIGQSRPDPTKKGKA